MFSSTPSSPMWEALFFGIIATSGTLWMLLCLLLVWTPWRVYEIKAPEKVAKLRKHAASHVSYLCDDRRGGGFFIKRDAVGYIRAEVTQKGNIVMRVYIITRKETLAKLLETDDVKGAGEKKKNRICVVYRSGNFFELTYLERFIPFTLKPRVGQKYIVDDVIGLYEEAENKRCCVFIHGPTGAGKSILGLFIAKNLNASYCTTWNPTEPGDTFDMLYQLAEPTREKPLVVVLDEVDGVIQQAHDRKIEKHNYIPIQIRDKTSWNGFLDNFNNGWWPNVILILISNKSDTEIGELDKSYLRAGRTHGIYEMDSPSEP